MYFIVKTLANNFYSTYPKNRFSNNKVHLLYLRGILREQCIKLWGQLRWVLGYLLLVTFTTLVLGYLMLALCYFVFVISVSLQAIHLKSTSLDPSSGKLKTLVIFHQKIFNFTDVQRKNIKVNTKSGKIHHFFSK